MTEVQREYAYSHQKPIASITIQVNTAFIHQSMNQFVKIQKISISFADIVLHAIAQTIKDFPEFNSYFEGKTISYAQVNMGYFINLGQGPKLAVLHDADRKSTQELSKEIKNLAIKYIHQELTDKDAQHSTFAITNLSAFGIFNIDSPVLEHHSTMISIASEFDAVDIIAGNMVSQRKFNVTLSFDARVADCQRALQFLNAIKKMLEGP